MYMKICQPNLYVYFLRGPLGIAPVNETLIGMAGNMEPEPVKKWLTKLEKLGELGD